MKIICVQCGEEYDPEDYGSTAEFCSEKCKKANDDALNSHLVDE